MKIKITTAGQPCRHCKTPVIDVDKSHKKPQEGQPYYYLGYFKCPNTRCAAIYMDDTRKVYTDSSFSPPEKKERVVLAWLKSKKKYRPLVSWDEVFKHPECQVKKEFQEEFERRQKNIERAKQNLEKDKLSKPSDESDLQRRADEAYEEWVGLKPSKRKTKRSIKSSDRALLKEFLFRIKD